MIDKMDVLKEIHSLSEADKTGTFFITTSDNRACHILIINGRVTALSHGPHRGEQVLKCWSDIQVERYSFKENVKMPLAGRSFLDDDIDMFRFLNVSFDKRDDSSPTVSASKKRIYRGHEVQESEQKTERRKSSSNIKKPLRIYRGQRVED